MMNLKDAASYALEQLHEAGADDAAVIVTSGKIDELNIDGGEFSLMRSGFKSGLSLKAIKEQKTGNIHTNWKIYPRSQGHSTVYLKNVVKDPTIQVGEYTTYDDYVNDPRDFERNCVLYHYPECNGDTLSIGKFCSIACGAKFIFNAANHALGSLSTYPFPIFFEEWGLPTDCASIAEAWDNHGSITIGNDVWIGYEAVILSGVTIGDGAIIGARAVVTRDIPPYTIAAGVPAKPIRRRFDVETIARLEELRWWDWEEEKIRQNIAAIRNGDIEALCRAAKE